QPERRRPDRSREHHRARVDDLGRETDRRVGDAACRRWVGAFGLGLKHQRSRTLTSAGTAHFSDTGFLSLAQGAVFNNTGRFEALSDADVANFFGGSATFLNAGTLIKTGAGTTTAFSGVTFNNTGTVDVQSGALSLAAGGTSSGAFTIGGAATLEFAGGISTLTTASSVAGTGTLRFASGTTNLLGTYLATGPLVLTGGDATFNTPNSIQATSLTLQGGTATFNTPKRQARRLDAV